MTTLANNEYPTIVQLFDRDTEWLKFYAECEFYEAARRYTKFGDLLTLGHDAPEWFFEELLDKQLKEAEDAAAVGMEAPKAKKTVEPKAHVTGPTNLAQHAHIGVGEDGSLQFTGDVPQGFLSTLHLPPSSSERP